MSNVSYPMGTREHPVDNIEDAIELVNRYGYNRPLFTVRVDNTEQLYDENVNPINLSSDFIIYGQQPIESPLRGQYIVGSDVELRATLDIEQELANQLINEINTDFSDFTVIGDWATDQEAIELIRNGGWGEYRMHRYPFDPEEEGIDLTDENEDELYLERIGG